MIFGSPELVPRWDVVRGRRIFSRVSRDAAARRRPDAILLHGLAVSSRYMTPLARVLHRHFTVWLPDLPGFGRSDRPPHALGPEALAGWLWDWMRAVDLPHATMIANSMGTQVLVELALAHPAAPDALVMLGPTFDRFAPHKLAHVWRLFLDQFHEPPSLVPLQAMEYLHFGTFRTWKTFTLGLAHPMRERASRVPTTTLILRGEKDPIVGQAWSESLAAAMPDARLQVVPGAGHALNYDAPDATSRAILSFVQARLSASAQI